MNAMKGPVNAEMLGLLLLSRFDQSWRPTRAEKADQELCHSQCRTRSKRNESQSVAANAFTRERSIWPTCWRWQEERGYEWGTWRALTIMICKPTLHEMRLISNVSIWITVETAASQLCKNNMGMEECWIGRLRPEKKVKYVKYYKIIKIDLCYLRRVYH